MTDMAPLRKSINQTTVNLAAQKGKGKIIETVEPADRRPILSDVHISDVEDSHPKTAFHSGCRPMQTAEPEPPLNGDQLLQVLSSMRKQMENQQMEMIWLYEVVAREKEAAARILT